jgi:hypothetical protein
MEIRVQDAPCSLFVRGSLHPAAAVVFLIIFSCIAQNSFWHAVLSTETHKNSARAAFALLSSSTGLKLAKGKQKRLR